MKLRITKEQLNELSEYQRQRLNSVWIPEKYDLAVAKICKDAINLEYQDYEFVIGDIDVYESAYHELHITLWDMKNMEQWKNEALQEQEFEEREYEQDYYNRDREDQWNDEYDNLELDDAIEVLQPASFNKEECLPLLNIGQMIKIIQGLNYGEGAFYLHIQKRKISSIGPDIYAYHRGGNEYEGEEICDVLWETIKSLLQIY